MQNAHYYFALCKPKVVLLMLFSSVIGMLLAIPTGSNWPVLKMVIGLMGIGVAACGGAVLNHLIDEHFDRMMQRTCKRPIPLQKVTPKEALWFAAILGGLSIILLININATVTFLTLAAMLGYAVVYTRFLKHKTPQNIVIGGLTGALPPLLGWSCLDPSMPAGAWLLVLIIFAWTPPHFWALAIYRLEDYKKAGIPMLPITHDPSYTHLQIKLYAWLTAAASLLPVLINLCGAIYAVGAVALNLFFLQSCYRLIPQAGHHSCMKTFRDSIVYLSMLFGVMLVDHFIYLPIPW